MNGLTKKDIVEKVYDGKGRLGGYAFCSLITGMRREPEAH